MERLKASDIASDIKSYAYNATLDQINKETNWLEVSCAIVCDENQNVFGIISESDILEIEKSQENLKAIRAWEKCSHKIISVTLGESIKNVINLMLKNNIHHMLVIGNSDCDNKYGSSLNRVGSSHRFTPSG